MDAVADIHALIAAARRGSADAIGRLFESARGRLLDVADRELPEDLRAKFGPSDLVQETAIDMQRDFAMFQGATPEELFAWLREILQNNLVDSVRRFRDTGKRDVAREVSLAGGAASHADAPIIDARLPDTSAIRREEAVAMAAALARLTAAERELLQLRYWQGLSFVEIAPLVGRSPDAVRKAWFRAVGRLRNELAASSTGAH